VDKTELKKQEVLKELEAWFSMPNCKEEYYNKRIESINDFLQNGTNNKAIFRQFDYLNTWFQNALIYRSLKNNDTSEHFLLAQNSYQTIELSAIIAKQYPGNPPVLNFHKIGDFLGNVIIQKWQKEGSKSLDYILEGLTTKFLKGGKKNEIATWLIIFLGSRAFNKKLEVTKYNFPPDFGPYQEIVNDWNTTDMRKLDDMVSQMCEYHLEQAQYGDDNNIFLFNSTEEFLYVYEILSWLSIREMIGLRNPETFNHPLMQLQFNRIPKSLIPFHPAEIYEKVIIRLKKEFSNTSFL
jgi:hypothetical protein